MCDNGFDFRIYRRNHTFKGRLMASFVFYQEYLANGSFVIHNSFGVCEGFNSGGGYSGVFRPVSVLNSIKTPDFIWGFDFHSSAPECTFCLTTVWFRPNFCYDKSMFKPLYFSNYCYVI